MPSNTYLYHSYDHPYANIDASATVNSWHEVRDTACCYILYAFARNRTQRGAKLTFPAEPGVPVSSPCIAVSLRHAAAWYEITRADYKHTGAIVTYQL